jgi:hypothetical protein
MIGILPGLLSLDASTGNLGALLIQSLDTKRLLPDKLPLFHSEGINLKAATFY